MTTPYKVKPGDLMKVWSMHRGAEQKQITLRVPLEIFFKIQAVEEMFAGKSRNDIVSDLLTTALDEFEESLPVQIHESEEVIDFGPDGEAIHETFETGLRVDFQAFIEKARKAYAKTGELKAVETEGDAA